ncbi:hypothetical protein C8J57DRAFT_1498550 [Mycena rebaudengoi]|nr:hypothetical protein C8J57DRAFT_1498550 [Mycena rebaudengoi]
MSSILETDSCGIPIRPTWSVNELLSSYPTPSIPPSAFTHLHRLSALIPPEEGTPEYSQLKLELEDLIRLVEAVKIVDTKHVVGLPDREDPGRHAADVAATQEVASRSLLKHSARAREGFYIVDADKHQ